MWAIIVNFHQPTHTSLIQNGSYRQTLEKTKNDGKHKKRDHINNCVSLVHSLMLQIYINRLETYISEPFGQTFCGKDRICYAFIPFSQKLNKKKVDFFLQKFFKCFCSVSFSRNFLYKTRPKLDDQKNVFQKVFIFCYLL